MLNSFVFTLTLLLGSLAHASDAIPSFKDYAPDQPTSPTGGRHNQSPNIISKQDKEFATKIRQASQQKANFANHFVLSLFGCGASCIMGFALDKHTGDVIWLPFTICCWADNSPDFMPIAFHKNSRLVIATGSRNEQVDGVFYYELKAGQFALVHENLQKGATPTPK